MTLVDPCNVSDKVEGMWLPVAEGDIAVSLVKKDIRVAESHHVGAKYFMWIFSSRVVVR